MLNRDELQQAVDLHRRSDNLLQWLSRAITKGVLRFDRAHEYVEEAKVAKGIERHYLNLPDSCRPSLDQLEPFARFFATYLNISFELVAEPRDHLISSCGCYCPMCSYFVSAPHLRVRKLSKRDKARARKIKIVAVQQLGRDLGVHLDEKEAEKTVDSPVTAMDISLMAYGQQLWLELKGDQKDQPCWHCGVKSPGTKEVPQRKISNSTPTTSSTPSSRL